MMVGLMRCAAPYRRGESHLRYYVFSFKVSLNILENIKQ